MLGSSFPETLGATPLAKTKKLLVDEGVTFNSFCGDEVTVMVDGVEANIISGKSDLVTGAGQLVVEANVCYRHAVQLNVLEHTFPTKSTKSSVIEYNPTGS